MDEGFGRDTQRGGVGMRELTGEREREDEDNRSREEIVSSTDKRKR